MKNKLFKTSIIMPAHNAETTIKLSIESVLSQNYSNWELLVIDDNSSDHTKSIVKDFAEKEPRIRLLKNYGKRGPATARNEGIKNAKGRFIAFLDSDDMWLPEKLNHQLNFMINNNFALSYSWFERIDNNGVRGERIIKVPTNITYKDLLKKNHIGCLTAIYDSKIIGKRYMPNIPVHQDWALWLSILREGYHTGGIDEVLALYRTGNISSVSGNKIKTAVHKWRIYRDLEKLSIFHSLYYIFHFALQGLRQSKI